MTTKISNVSTVMQIESTHLGFTFKGSVKFFNKQKVITEINCRVTPVSESNIEPNPMTDKSVWYIVTRGIYNNSMGMGTNLQDSDENAILSAGIEFEAMLQDKITTGTFE